MNTVLKMLLEDADFAKSYRHEELIVDVTESIYEIMKKNNMNKSKLAKASGLSKARITKLLDGSANMTLKSIADIAHALKVTPKIHIDSTESFYTKISTISDWSNSEGLSYNPPKQKPSYKVA